MRLTHSLALRIAKATGVDEAWFFAGDAKVPPAKGLTLMNAGRGKGEDTKADYEFYRALVEIEAKSRDHKAWEATVKNAAANCHGHWPIIRLISPPAAVKIPPG